MSAPRITQPKGPFIFYGFLAFIFIAVTITLAALGQEVRQRMPVPTKVPLGTRMRPQIGTRTPGRSTRSTGSFETGIVFPRWSIGGYGPTDRAYQSGLSAITEQTAARWLEMPILLRQTAPNGTILYADHAPSVANFTQGIIAAHQRGYHVFVVPLFTVTVPGGWAGMIQFHSYNGEAAWFASLIGVYGPYIKAAESVGAEQLSIGTELSWMQKYAPAALWQQYITQVKALFHGRLTYDLNWPDIGLPVTPWMKSLSTLGVSEYMPLVDTPQRVNPGRMPALFRARVQPQLDALSAQLGKPIIVSEIGYRDSFDALYNPYDTSARLPEDQPEQAGALGAALSSLVKDTTHIGGVFCWGWHDSGPFDLEGTQAARVIGLAYRLL